MKPLTFILFLISFSTFAQKSAIFRIDSLPTEGVVLDKNWKWQLGDNPDFAKPDFDDSAWTPIDPTKDVMDLPQMPKNGQIGWLRLTFSMDSSINYPLVLMVEQVGASEIFLNGTLIHRFGIVSTHPKQIKGFEPLSKPFTFPVMNNSRPQILAIRYALQPEIIYTSVYGKQNLGFKAQLMSTDNGIEFFRKRTINESRFTAQDTGVFGVLSILFFTLFLFFPTIKVNLYFAIYCAFHSFVYYSFFTQKSLNDTESYFLSLNFNLVIQTTSHLFMLLAVYTILEQKKGVFFWFLFIFGLVYMPSGFYLYGMNWLIMGFGFTNLINIEITRVAFIALKNKIKGAWIIAIGGVIFIIGWAMFTMQFLHIYDYTGPIPFFEIAVLSIPISFAIYLAYSSGLTNRTLQQKLTEVERLSTEKQQILVNQKETLEKQVTERTAELAHKNRELEIEAALEKIRSRSLAMRYSDEIENVVAVLFEKLKELGLVFDGGAAIHIFTEGSKDAVIWVVSPQQPPTKITLPYDAEAFVNNPIIQDVWHAKETGNHIFNKIYTFEEKNRYFSYVFKYNDYSKITEVGRNFILSVPNYTASFVTEKNSLLGANSWTGQLFSEPDFEILKRVATVFEQAYVRFLDLQKAEAQTLDLAQEKQQLEKTLIELRVTQTQLVEKEKIATSAAVQLKELDAVKTRLYTNITHEFRTPLTVILGMAQQAKDKPQEHLQEGLKMITRNGQNLLNLVNQMLDLSKLESGHLDLHYQQGDVVNFLKYIVESLHSLAENKGIQMHFLTDLDSLTMDIDEARLQQVVSNLLSNAVKFTPKGGNIYMTVGRQNNRLSLKVKDTGEGISEAQLPYIFDRFYQADATATRHGEGTGIGLSLTRELVKLMQGTISVKSHLHKGSEFEVLLPITHLAEIKKTKDKVLKIAKNEAIFVSVQNRVVT